MGYKRVTIEEGLSADINTYLMNQMVVVCTSSTRPSSPPDGMHIWQSDDSTLVIRASSAWRPVARTHYAVKTADEAVTSSTTLQDDDELLLSMAANATYRIRSHLFADGSGGDLKISWTAPTGATMVWTAQAPNAAQTDERLSNLSVISYSAPSDTAGIGTFADRANYLITGLLITGGSSGTLRLRWAQNSSSGTSTTVRSPSSLMATRVA